jgi:protein TonB
MSYKALLFCGDERTARVVTQVLSELEFTVERGSEALTVVSRLANEHFDALVVDCQNDQDASLLFKGARDSSSNHASLAVAVVEGQSGVAKAFRIGANLVLTKPINIEQSKGTLRVARGLLRKNEAKRAPANAGTSVAIDAPGFDRKPPVFVAPVAPAQTAPFSSLELEEEPVPTAEAAEVAVLESLPNAIKPATPSEPTWAPSLTSSAEPIAASPAKSGGTAAAAAPALIPRVVEIKTAPPLASQEPVEARERLPLSVSGVSEAPTFSVYQEAVPERSSRKPIAIASTLIIVCGLGYALWQKPQLLSRLHRAAPTETVQTPAPAAAPSSFTGNMTSVESDLQPSSAPTTPESSSPATLSKPPERMHDIETIQVEEPTENPASKITVTPKPLVVNTRAKGPEKPKVVQSTPQPPSISAEEGTDKLAGLVTTKIALPKPEPGSIRISQGVSQGLIVKRVTPVYPPIALQLHKQGTVELLAKIGKDGQITSLKILNGDSALAKSAADAVWQWKYRPYLLNGEPVEIETQITINFKTPQ